MFLSLVQAKEVQVISLQNHVGSKLKQKLTVCGVGINNMNN